MRSMNNVPLEAGARLTPVPGRPAPGWGKIKIFLEMIKFEHTIFALPFAYIGALLVEQSVPSAHNLFWITVAMAGARTAAMSLNRVIDLHIDARNPRTADRALPRGLLSPSAVWVLIVVSMALLLVATLQLSPLAVKLFPLAVFILVAYPYTKRFTWLCHIWLGGALGCAPLGAWIAIADGFTVAPVLLALGVIFWVAGFDIIYSSMDYEFDRAEGIHSIPSRFGLRAALRIAAVFHAVASLCIAAAGVVLELGTFYFIGVGLAVLILCYEHAIVRPEDLSRVGVAFFNVNAVLGVVVFVFTVAEVVFR